MKRMMFIILLLVLVPAVAWAIDTISIKFEAETGVLSGLATKISDTTASSGSAVQFSTSTTPPPTSTIDHGEDVNETNTGYTAYFDPVLGRKLTQADLTVVNGSIETTHDGQVIEKVWVKGRIKVKHNNVTIRGIYLDHPPTVLYGITWDTAIRPTGTNVEYCELDGNGGGDAINTVALYIGHITVSHCNIHHWGGGSILLGGTATRPSTVRYSYAHSIAFVSGGHHNALATFEQQYVTFYRNNVDGGNTAAMTIFCDEGHISGRCSDITITENLFNVDRANYCLRPSSWDGNSPEPFNMKVTGNKFGRKYHQTCGSSAPYADRNVSPGINGNEWSDNKWQDTGQLIP